VKRGMVFLKGTALVVFAGTLIAFGDAGAAADSRPEPGFVTLRVTHRVYVDFEDTLTVKLHERHVVGDTEFSCEVLEFYPQFAINDSTKAIVSLSDEPKNPAFKIAVYENDEKKEDTWAFYGIDIPHFGRTSYLAFKVLSFEYRGEVIGGEAGGGEESR